MLFSISSFYFTGILPYTRYDFNKPVQTTPFVQRVAL